MPCHLYHVTSFKRTFTHSIINDVIRGASLQCCLLHSGMCFMFCIIKAQRYHYCLEYNSRYTQGCRIGIDKLAILSLPSVKFCCRSIVSDSATPWTAGCQASLSITNLQSLLKLMSIESAMPSSHLISVVPFSSCFQSFPESGSFPMSQFFTSGGQIAVSASASVLSMTIQD